MRPSARAPGDGSPQVHVLSVPPQAKGQRLDQYLAAAISGLSRARIQGLLTQGAVLLDGRVPKAAARLAGGESAEVTVPLPRSAQAKAEDLPIEILHEDRSLVVLNKAAGMVVHPAAGNWQGTLVNALLHRVKGLTGVGGELRPGIVHRLDKDTSGCLVVAKTEPALLALQRAFKAREVDKVYLALVHGKPPAQARIETLYGRHPRDRKRFSGKVREGKLARTDFVQLESFDGAALLQVQLHTGRTHQIRAHLAEAGFPLFGDQLYGRARKGKGVVPEAVAALGRQGLHAWKLAFPHPRTGKRAAFEAPLPGDFQRALEVLRA